MRTLQGQIILNGKTILLRPNYVYLIPLGTSFDYTCQNDMKKIFFHVAITMQNNFDLFDSLQDCYELPLEPGYAKKLANYYQEKDLFRIQEAICSALARFSELTHVNRQLQKAYSPLMVQAFQYIEAHLSARLTVKEVAKKLMISDSGLCKRFRSEVGCSAGQYIEMLVMQEAKMFLLSTDLSITEVAEHLQFCDRFYFSRFFRRHTGETPRLFRQRYNGIT